jgi:hypothetical protein
LKVAAPSATAKKKSLRSTPRMVSGLLKLGARDDPIPVVQEEAQHLELLLFRHGFRPSLIAFQERCLRSNRKMQFGVRVNF